MRVLVLGAGVIGVTTAYYLAAAGHEVVVLDRRSGPGLETSFANAGEISPGYAAPWASPGLPAKALKWLLMRHGPLVLRPRMDLAMWRWVVATLRNCSSGRYALNKARMLRLATYSRSQLETLRVAEHLAYDQGSGGTLQLFRTARQLDQVHEDIAVLEQYGVEHQLLDTAGCIHAEPALERVASRVAGGLRLLGDETGDCYKFTVALAARAAERGVRFEFGCEIQDLRCSADRILAVDTSRGSRTGDAYVVALGSHTSRMLRKIGLAIPIYPVKGYSITLPISDPAAAPRSTVMDETYKVAITRLGDRLRVGGTAELAGYSTRLSGGRRATLEHSARSLFPDAARFEATELWSGLRPMTPDGTPVVGATGLRNLYLNSGHGTLGWTMACGAGRLIADLVSGRPPEIEASDLGLARYLH